MQTRPIQRPLAVAVFLLLPFPLTGQAWQPNPDDRSQAIRTGDFTGYFANLSAWLRGRVPAKTSEITGSRLKALLRDPSFMHALIRRHFMEKVWGSLPGVQNLGAFAKADPRNREFLAWLMARPEAMDMVLLTRTPSAGFARADNSWSIKAGVLTTWRRIWQADPDSRDGLYLRLAVATVLRPPGTGNRGAGMQKKPDVPTSRYMHFKQAHEKHELFPSFDHLTAWELTHVVSSGASNEDLAWGRQMLNTFKPDLRVDERVVGMTSQVKYQGSQIPYKDFSCVLAGGGKCGPRSSFGVFINQAFGIPAVGVGQPGHAAVAYKHFRDGWQVCYGRGWNVSKVVDRYKMSGAEFLQVAALRSRGTFAAAEPAAGKQVIPWDVDALYKAPKFHPTKLRPAKGMKAFFYEGAAYKGKPTRVFAYYAAPKGKRPAGGWPAVVCAHGGGGTAYPEWVRYWNGHGYAALAMDLEGHLPGGKHHGVEGNHPTGKGHPNAGPKRIDWFGDRDLPDNEQWFYHAVADVIRANSLLRTIPGINPKKIGLTGISWGGTVVSTVAGVDSRFAFVIPVYGGGFIHESDNPGLAQWFPPKHMTAKQFRDYRTKWDPSAHLPHAKMPMLWVSSVADPVFQVDIFSKSAQAAGGPSTLCLRPWMIHAHGSGWNDACEIYAFADSIVKDGPPLPTLERPRVDRKTGIVRTKYKGDFTEAWLYYTTSRAVMRSRKWQFIQCNVGKDTLTARTPLPKTTSAFLVYVFKVGRGGHRSNHSASELVVLRK